LPQYRRTGELPWLARHLCWSLPGLAPAWPARPRWSWPAWSRCLTTSTSLPQSASSGYITCSAASSNTAGSGEGPSTAATAQQPGGKESSVVRFL